MNRTTLFKVIAFGALTSCAATKPIHVSQAESLVIPTAAMPNAIEPAPVDAAPATLDSRDAVVEEVRRRAERCRAEIARLGPSHPWAGHYHEGDGLFNPVSFLIAPESGCLVTSVQCLGEAANWGTVTETKDGIHIHFDRVVGAILSGRFCSDFKVVGTGADRTLVATSGFPRSVLHLEVPARGDLEPVDGWLLDPANVRLRNLLLGVPPGDFWMLCTPLSGPAYAVSMTVASEIAASDTSHGDSVVMVSIHVATIGNTPDTVVRKSIDVDVSSIRPILTAWRAVVRRARYREPEYRGAVDGEKIEIHRDRYVDDRYEFQFGEYHGTTDSKYPGFAADLIQLAHALADCVELVPADQPAALSKCVEMAKKLEQEAVRASW